MYIYLEYPCIVPPGNQNALVGHNEGKSNYFKGITSVIILLKQKNVFLRKKVDLVSKMTKKYSHSCLLNTFQNKCLTKIISILACLLLRGKCKIGKREHYSKPPLGCMGLPYFSPYDSQVDSL